MTAFASVIDPIIANVVNPIIELMFAIALIVFVYGVVETLIKGGDAEARTKGKVHLFGGIVGMVIMVSAWGIINIVASTVKGF